MKELNLPNSVMTKISVGFAKIFISKQPKSFLLEENKKFEVVFIDFKESNIIFKYKKNYYIFSIDLSTMKADIDFFCDIEDFDLDPDSMIENLYESEKITKYCYSLVNGEITIEEYVNSLATGFKRIDHAKSKLIYEKVVIKAHSVMKSSKPFSVEYKKKIVEKFQYLARDIINAAGY